MCWEQGKTEQTALQKRPQESCVCPSAAGLQPKKPLCCSCFLSSSFFGCPHSFHTKYSIISKRINQYQTVHTCYRTRTSAWALLQKMTFSILRSHLNLKLLSSVKSPHLTWAIGLTTKTFHFAHHVLFLLFIWNHTKLCLGLSQGVPRYWEWMTKRMSSHLQDGTRLLQSWATVTVLSLAPPSHFSGKTTCVPVC